MKQKHFEYFSNLAIYRDILFLCNLDFIFVYLVIVHNDSVSDLYRLQSASSESL